MFFFIYEQLAEGPGVARGKKMFEQNFFEKTVKKMFEIFFSNLALDTHECPQKISAQSVQPFGRLYATYIYIRMSCFII